MPNYERNVFEEDEKRDARKAERRKLIEAKMQKDKENQDKNGIPGDIFSKIYENAEKERAEAKEMSEEDKKAH